jgi:hypothetical protein
MRIAYIFAAGAAALFFASTVDAKPLVTEQFKANRAISLDPAKAYLLVRSPGMDLKLLRVPTASERAAYAEERGAALAKARAKYLKAAAEYPKAYQTYRELSQTGSALEPVKPIEPTDENLAFKAIESDNFVTIWGGRVFDNGGPRTAHLIAVPPGTYRIYGQVLEAPNGSASGFCLCMGTVQFDAAPGTITDMGTIHYPKAEALADKVKPSWNGLTPGRGGLTAMRVEPADSLVYVPPALASMPRVSAAYRASGKIDNFFGLMIDRLTPLPGVLSYRRDQIIDERTGTALASN